MTESEAQNLIHMLCGNDEELCGIHRHITGKLNFTEKESLFCLEQINDLRSLMKDGVANFTFRKTGGEVRTAYGTRVRELITRHAGPEKPSGQKKEKSYDTFPYFDIEKRAWRCFKVNTLIDINRKYTI